MTSPTEIVLALRPRLSDDQLAELFAAGWPGVSPPSPERLARHALCWVGAFEGERLVGFVHAAWDGDVHAFVLDPVVHPEFRRRGIGGSLLAALRDDARGRGVRWLHVDFEPHLSAFYARAGFAPTRAGLMRLEREEGDGALGAEGGPSR